VANFFALAVRMIDSAFRFSQEKIAVAAMITGDALQEQSLNLLARAKVTRPWLLKAKQLSP